MHDVLLVALQMVLGVLVPAAVVRRDVRRLSSRELARAWPDVSVWSAAALVSVLAVLFHFARTRRTFLGFLLGLGWSVVAYLAVLGPALLLDAAWPE
jgi:hypothetical protein